MKTFEQPNRKTLILGAIIVQLHEHRRERISEIRLSEALAKNSQIVDWRNNPQILDIDACEKSVLSSGLVRTANQEILDSLAYTRQSLYVSYEEWDEYAKVERLEAFPSAEAVPKAQPKEQRTVPSDFYKDLVRPGIGSLF